MVVGLLLPSCFDPRIALEYQFAEGETHTYRWTITATSKLTSPGETRTDSIRSVITARQTVEGLTDGGARLRLVMTPVEIVENGITLDLPGPTTLDVEIDRAGKVVRVARPAHLPPAAVQQLEIDSLFQEVLPPLPQGRTEEGASWPAPLEVAGNQTQISLAGMGRLEGYELEERRRLARIKIEREGSLITVQRIGRADIELSGSTSRSTVAEIDIDNGLMVNSNLRSTSNFEVASEGGALSGLLKLRLDVEVRLMN